MSLVQIERVQKGKAESNRFKSQLFFIQYLYQLPAAKRAAGVARAAYSLNTSTQLQVLIQILQSYTHSSFKLAFPQPKAPS